MVDASGGARINTPSVPSGRFRHPPVYIRSWDAFRDHTTRTQRIFLRPDGIVQTVNVSREEQKLADAQANVAASFEVAGKVRRPVFVDTRIPAPLSSEAQGRQAASVVVRLFDDEASALAWLKQYPPDAR